MSAPVTSPSAGSRTYWLALIAAFLVAACSAGGAPASGALAPISDVSVFASASVYDVAGTTAGFVAVGSVSEGGHTNGAAWGSTDGHTWHAASGLTAPDTAFLRVVDGGSGWLAVAQACPTSGVECEGQSIWTSADGMAWHHQADLDMCCVPVALASGPFGFVVVGSDFSAGAAVPPDVAVFVSPDGAAWSRATGDTSFHAASMGGVTAGGPGVVALGSGSSSSLAWTSTDGRTWAVVPSSAALASGETRDMTRNGGQLIGVGRDGSIGASWVSTDGVSWSRSPSQAALDGATMSGVTTAGSRLIAVGHDGSTGLMWQSTDGLTWTPLPLGNDATEITELTAVAASGASVVVFGASQGRKVVVLAGAIK